MTPLKENKVAQLAHDEHKSVLIVGERGTGKTTRVIALAVKVLREGGRFLANIDINPQFLDTVMTMPYLEHWDNVVVRLPDAPHRFSLHVEIIGDGWYVHKNVKKYSVTVFDECANYLNSRKWADDERQDFIDAMIHQRKRGYAEYYLAHSLNQIDAQVRDSYISSIELLLNRAPQLSRRWLGGNNPVVCFLKRGSDGKFPADVTDKKVWTQGLVTTQAYTKSNPLVWDLYSTSQMFDFENYRSNTSPLVSDGVHILGFPVHNIFAGFKYVSDRKDSRGNLKREPKQFAYFRLGSYAVISPRLLMDCYYIQSKTIAFFESQQKVYDISGCVVPVFPASPKVSKVQISNANESKYLTKVVTFVLVVLFVIGGFFYYLYSGIGGVVNPHPLPVPSAVVPVPSPSEDVANQARFKKPEGAKFATYPVCEFFNVLEQDRVTYFDQKHLIDRDWLLQYFRSNPMKITNFFIDAATGMPRYTVMFYSKDNASKPIDAVSETELFNYGWRSAVTGFKDSYLAIYNPNIWLFFPISGMSSSSLPAVTSSGVFTLPISSSH